MTSLALDSVPGMAGKKTAVLSSAEQDRGWRGCQE
jgi:hypothetical protein